MSRRKGSSGSFNVIIIKVSLDKKQIRVESLRKDSLKKKILILMKPWMVTVFVMMLVLNMAGCSGAGISQEGEAVQGSDNAEVTDQGAVTGDVTAQNTDGSGDEDVPDSGDAGSGDGTGQNQGDAGSVDGTSGNGDASETGDGAASGDHDAAGVENTGLNDGTGRVSDEPVAADRYMDVEGWIMTHSIEEKIAQMFIVTPESIGGGNSSVTAGPELEQGIAKYPVGGFIYFAHNLQSQVQTAGMLNMTKEYYSAQGLVPPFLSVDEEGGTVARISGNPAFGIANVGPMINVGNTGDVSVAAYAGTYIASYLKGLGFNMDMAPVADVFTNPSNTVIGNRAFGSDPYLVAEMVVSEMTSMSAGGVMPVVKHFPGHGATEADSHYGYASVSSTLDELVSCELIPFASAIGAGCQCIMVGHISVPGVTGNEVPATLSPYMMTTVLRNRMGFKGLIITDAMNMGAITDQYDSASAAVLSINAGADIILMPVDFEAAYSGVLQAVNDGTISEDRIDESVRRILNAKKGYVWPEN